MLGYLCLALGAVLTLVASGVIPADPSQFEAPRWMLVLAGLNVMACGGSLITQKDSAPQLCCVGFILISFAILGGWVAFFSKDDAIAGGIPFIPRGINIFLARCLFATGPLFCLIMLRHLGQQLLEKLKTGR